MGQKEIYKQVLVHSLAIRVANVIMCQLKDLSAASLGCTGVAPPPAHDRVAHLIAESYNSCHPCHPPSG